MGELFSADVDDLDRFVTTSTGQVQALSTALSSVQGQRLTLASAPFPGFVDATTTDRLESLLAFLTENERFVADIADALVWHGDHMGRGTYLASVDAIQAELDDGQDQRLQQIEDQLVAGGIDPAEAARIRAEIEAQLTADPTLAFGDAVVAGFAVYQGVTVDEAQRAARAFTLHPAEVAATLDEHFDDIASRSGQDHLISLEDLHAVIGDPDAPPELRDAAYRVAADGILFLDLDTAHQTDLSDEPLTVGFAWHRSDELIGRDDLREFPTTYHQAQILLAWHPLIDTANQGYDLDEVDSHVSADDVIAFVEDDEIPLYIRLAIYDVYAERHDLDVERRVELEQELAFAPGGGIGGVEVLDASRLPSGPGNPLLVNPGTGPTTAPRTTAPPAGGGGGRAAAAAIIAQLLVTSAEFGWNQGRQAAIEDAGNPRFVFTDPFTGVRTVVDPSQLSHLSPDQLRAWVAHQAATGQPPAELTDQVAPHRYRDVDGQWRLSDTNEPVWSGDEPGPAVLLEPTPPPGVYVDANGHWRYLHDGHLWDGYLLSPTEREEDAGDLDDGSRGRPPPTGPSRAELVDAYGEAQVSALEANGIDPTRLTGNLQDLFVTLRDAANDHGAQGELDAITRWQSEGRHVHIPERSTTEGVTNPDYLVDGHLIEVKTRRSPIGDRSVKDLIRDANKQVRQSTISAPGEVEIQLVDEAATADLTQIERQVNGQFNANRSSSLSRVAIYRDGELIAEWVRTAGGTIERTR